MSGGSFDYLQFRLGTPDEYSELLDEALRQGVPPDSKAIRDLYAIIGALSRAELLRKKLEPIVYAVEWCCSCDTSREDTQAAARLYEMK